MKRRTLTPEQTAKRDARRARFKELWRTVAAMPEAERVAAAGKLGFVSCEGTMYSLHNMLLLATQVPNGSVFGGFRQWLKQGRCVRKGEHGAMIWVPKGERKTPAEPVPDAAEGDKESMRFLIGTVFDISQTDEVGAAATAAAEVAAGQLELV